MDLPAFKATLADETPPAGLDRATLALWHAARGAWDTAHALAQAQDDAAGAWVHAHLHRVEGDNANARYWYRRAQRPTADDPLEAEWDRIAAALLAAR